MVSTSALPARLALLAMLAKLANALKLVCPCIPPFLTAVSLVLNALIVPSVSAIVVPLVSAILLLSASALSATP